MVTPESVDQEGANREEAYRKTLAALRQEGLELDSEAKCTFQACPGRDQF
jgi:hypothetical protein